MKIFKVLSVMMIVALSAGFASCSNDDDKDASIVGTWKLVRHEYNVRSNGVMVDRVEEGTGTEVMMFNSDGKGVDAQGDTFSWKLDGNKIATTYVDEDGDEFTLVGEVQKLTGDELVVYTTSEDDGNIFYDKMQLTRVK